MFQVGGNVGQAIGPLLAALIIMPHGQPAVAWFAGVALAGMIVLGWVGAWYRDRLRAPKPAAAKTVTPVAHFGRARVGWALVILLALTFSKNFYMACFTSYYTFYLIHHFGVSVQDSQIYLFVFGAAVAIGTLVGGWLGDRIGRLNIMWLSILGVLPFANDTGDARYDVLQRGLMDMVTTDLAGLEAVQVVERARLDAVLGELRLQRGQGFETLGLCRDALAEFRADYEGQGVKPGDIKGDCYVMPSVGAQ